MKTALLWIELFAVLFTLGALNVTYAPAIRWQMPYHVFGGVAVVILCETVRCFIDSQKKTKNPESAS